MEKRTVGEVVKFIDPQSKVYDALVTAVWSETCLNLVYVSGDESKQDSCGRQIERTTSVIHQSIQTAPGNFWAGYDEVIVFPKGMVIT